MIDENRINSGKTLFEKTEKLKTEHNLDNKSGQFDVSIINGIPLLSQDQIALLQWLEDQPLPLSLRQLEQTDVPGYTQNRLIQLWEREHLIDRTFEFEELALVGKYAISDKGRAVLLKLEQERRQEAEEKERRAQANELAHTQTAIAKSQNRILIAQTIIAFATFVAGLFTEHFIGVIAWFRGLFR